MGDRYLTDLADVLRGAGLVVVEWSGWETRARGSGGFDGNRPWAIAWHHTASRSSPEADAGYIATGDDDAPLANLLVDRDGAVWVIAAGATNTNGKGYAMRFSRGTVPDDQMNTHAVGIEIANNGVGETYPTAQIEAAFAASLAIAAAYGLDPADVGTHQAWAPDRKIDPATADAASGFWPRSVTSSGSWSLDDLRAECRARAGSTPPPLPPIEPVEGDTVLVVALDSVGTAWIGNGVDRIALDDPAVFDRYVLVWAGRLLNTSGKVVRGWGDVVTVDDLVIEALGRT